MKEPGCRVLRELDSRVHKTASPRTRGLHYLNNTNFVVSVLSPVTKRAKYTPLAR